ncbi:hypothetical protein ACJA88_005924 [Fusarium oxysporum]
MEHIMSSPPHEVPLPPPGQDEALGGIEESPHPNGFHHQQSTSLDQGLAQSPRQEDPSTRYTPPVQTAPPISRPASGLSNPAHQAYNDYRQSSGEPSSNGRNHVVIKVGMVGDAQIGKTSLMVNIKEWYRQGRGFNKTAIPILVGTKYDHFVNFPPQDQEEISNQARRFAKAMRAALIFSSTSHSINVQKIFKIVLSKAFDLKCTIPEIENVGEPLLLYQSV